MLKKNAISVLLLFGALLPFLASAQMTTMVFSPDGGLKKTALKNPEPVIGQVFYDFTYVADTTQPDKPTKELMELDYSKSYSQFSSRTFVQSDSLMKLELQKQLTGQVDPSNIKINMSGFSRKGSAETFVTTTKEIVELKSQMMKTYLVKDIAKTIDWQVEDSTKSIGGYTCQKATGKSHGRNYTSWFTTDLPYSYGPRKLSGLPGLVLEAYDDKKQIFYTFNHIATTGNGSEIGLPQDGIASTDKEFKQMQEAFRANPQAAMQGNMPAGAMPSGGTSQIKTMSVTTSERIPQKQVVRINNPIELSAD